MLIKRDGEARLSSLLTGKKVVILLGARQVGKTTLTETVLAGRKTLFLNFDLMIDQQRFLAAATLPPADAIRSLGAPDILVVDEAQRLSETGLIVKGWHDARVPTKFLLLGSSSLDIQNRSAEPLTGRNVKMILPPLLFDEVVRSSPWFSPAFASALAQRFPGPVRTALMESLAYGNYPEVVTSDDKPGLLRNLAADYLWKDILLAGQIRHPDPLRRLLMLLAHQVGSEVSVNELATQLGSARATVERYLDLLEQTFVVFRLPSFSTNPRKEVAKGRKIYFWDTGIRNALLNAFSTSEQRPDIGPLWENWVIAELAKRVALEGRAADLFFWRSRAQSEVDLVVRTGDRLEAYEIKWRAKKTPGCRAFRDAYGVDVATIDPSDPFAWGKT